MPTRQSSPKHLIYSKADHHAPIARSSDTQVREQFCIANQNRFWLLRYGFSDHILKVSHRVAGYIFRAQHIHSGQVVALKLQRLDHETPTNRYERYLYPLLQGGEGMPILWASGEQKPWDFLAMELLGSSLDSLIRHSKKDCLDVRTVCTIAMQLVSLIH